MLTKTESAQEKRNCRECFSVFKFNSPSEDDVTEKLNEYKRTFSKYISFLCLLAPGKKYFSIIEVFIVESNLAMQKHQDWPSVTLHTHS